MAYIKWKPIKVHLDKAFEYIMNDLKTDQGELVTTFLCSKNPKEAKKEFLLDNKFNLKKNILAHHLIQSFDPKDKNITPEKAHKIGIELCNKIFKGDRRYIISTHIDRGHIHNHIIFNSCSIRKYEKKFNNSIKNLYKVREISDEICIKENVKILDVTKKGSNKSYYEYIMNLKNISWKQHIKLHLNDCLEYCKNFDELKNELKIRNWKIEKLEDNYIFTNLKNNKKVKSLKLGEKYKVESIEKILEKNKIKKLDEELSSFQEIKEHSKNKNIDRYVIENNLIQIGKIEKFLKEENLSAKSYINKFLKEEKNLKQIEEKISKLVEEKGNLNLLLSTKFDYNVVEKISKVNNELRILQKDESDLITKIIHQEQIKNNILKIYDLEKYYLEEKNKIEKTKENKKYTL